MAERGVNVSYESIRLWCIRFGPKFARQLKYRHQGYGDTFYIDEVFVKIRGKQRYLWRAVDQNGCELDILVTKKRDKKAAVKFFKKLFKGQTSRGSPATMQDRDR